MYIINISYLQHAILHQSLISGSGTPLTHVSVRLLGISVQVIDRRVALYSILLSRFLGACNFYLDLCWVTLLPYHAIQSSGEFFTLVAVLFGSTLPILFIFHWFNVLDYLPICLL